MPTCATQQKVTESAPIYNLILPVPDTDFRDSLDEVDELSRFARSEVNSMDMVSERKRRMCKRRKLDTQEILKERACRARR